MGPLGSTKKSLSGFQVNGKTLVSGFSAVLEPVAGWLSLLVFEKNGDASKLVVFRVGTST
jgi:hypothetical protein